MIAIWMWTDVAVLSHWLFAVFNLSCGTGSSFLRSRWHFVGHSDAEARETLQKSGYLVSTDTQTHLRKDSIAAPVRLLAIRPVAAAPQTSDQVVVWLTLPPDTPRVVGIYREIHYSGSESPSVRSFFEAAKAKAGFEVYRHLPNVAAGYTDGDQLIRWRPDGKKISTVGMLFSSLPNSGQSDPCIQNYAGWGERFGQSDMSRYFTFDYIRKAEFFNSSLLEGEKAENSTQAFFSPSRNCGTTFLSRLHSDSSGYAAVARMLLTNQTAMVENSNIHRKWLRVQDDAYHAERAARAAKPDI